MKKAVISSPFLQTQVRKIFGDFPRVFLYHRFSREGELLPHRVSAENFRWQLERIVSRYKVLSFGECIEHFHRKGCWPENCAVITVDDGYRDFYEVAYPELVRLNLSATFFVTVNFVDQKLWLWPDRLIFALEKNDKKKLEIHIDNKKISLTFCNAEQKFIAWKLLSDFCIKLDNINKLSFITEVEEKLEVDLPLVPPEGYAAVTWDELTEMQSNGIEIGSHTMNHPILSRINSEDLRHEIVTSRTILEEKLQKPIRTFCYPNGQPGDINAEVVEAVRDAGYIGAPYFFNLSKWDPYLVPRIGISNDKYDFLSKLAGIELAGYRLREVFKSQKQEAF